MIHMMTHTRTHEKGAISGMQVAFAGLIVLVLGLGSFGIWAFVNYQDAKSNVNDKIAVAVAQGQKDQADQDQAKYAEQIKEPYKTFKGPDDYCGLTFNYPKTWSAYVSNDAADGGTYQAYLQPDVVPPTKSETQFALRVIIAQRNYDQVVDTYSSQVTLGKLHSSNTNSLGNAGTRLDGNFSTNIRGAAVLYPCRNYTIQLFTDADTFKPEFEKIIQTINYNK